MAAIAMVMAASLAPARAQEEQPRWFVFSEPEVVAMWGIPQTDAVGFSVRCAPGGDVVMVPALFAMEQPAVAPDITFMVDEESFVRPATLTFSDLDGAWQAEAVVSRSDGLINALRRGSRLSYDFSPPLREGDRFSLSLTGSAKAIDEVLKSC